MKNYRMFEEKTKENCRDDANICLTYLKTDLLRSLPTDVDTLSLLFFFSSTV